MRSYEVRRHITAHPAAIWAILTDGDRLVAAGTGIRGVRAFTLTAAGDSTESAR